MGHSTAARVSETAAPVDEFGQGWIERAVLAGSEPATVARSATLADRIVRSRIGGAFWAPAPHWRAGVRVVVKTDHPARLDAGVRTALTQAPAAEIGVLLADRPGAARAAAALKRQGLAVHVGEADWWAVLDQADTLMVDGSDDLGFWALARGRAVRALSGGYLSGWGLTNDPPGMARRGSRSFGDLAAAALIDGVRYRDPFTGRIARCEAIADWLSDLRRIADADRDLACLTGMAWWKQRRIKRFFAPGSAPPRVLARADACVDQARRRQGSIGVWPSMAPDGLVARAAAAGIALRRVEDGFVRSVGLGSDLLPPCSIVVDRLGIYYDPSRPSELERMLAETDFTPELLARARALIDRLVAAGLTKYNTGGAGFARPAARRVVLAPGQVEDDQSFRLGGADCAGNLDLLRRVRAQEPDAFILYRPHPDVEAGNRLGAIADADALQYADQIDRSASISALLDQVDAVHVLSSLTGFEALLRGRAVTVHGQPFYCGWGLTQDLAPPPRRGRALSLEALVAGALILYPRYLDPVTRMLCPPEVLVERLARLDGRPSRATLLLRRLRRRFEHRRPASPGPAAYAIARAG